jgi:hypothetical protein
MSAPGRPPANKSCLFIQGSDSNVTRRDGGIGLLGNNDLDRLVGDPAVPLVQLSADIFERSSLPAVTSYRCLINQISDADRNRTMLEHLSGLLSGFEGRIVNRPSDVLKTSRDQVAKQLAGTPGLRVPKVVRLHNLDDAQDRIERAGLSFPIILRRAGTHGGQILGLFANMDDLRRAIPADGDLFATEFADYRSADGLYRKYRVCVYGRSIILRHAIISDEWNIHGRNRMQLMLGRADLRDEERRVVERPRQTFASSVLQTLRAIRKRIPLDYFGVDFGIAADGAVVLFEANATMDFFSSVTDPQFAYVHRPLTLARRAVRAMIPELELSDAAATPSKSK